MNNNELLLAFYGDDFTGSTDALEFLSRAGARTLLFLQPPTPQEMKRYPGLDAIGIAGLTRSLPPAEMEQVLRPAFSALRLLNPRHVHYKVCSTFDSSPRIGSIGKAMEVGAEVFQGPFIPLLVAAPALGRYCAFGNLFARMGIGSQGAIYRLDRHPSMSRHPVTPSEESDLRLHLSRQTSKKTGLIDLLQIGQPDAAEKLSELVQSGAEVVLFDALYPEQMRGIGQLIDDCAEPGNPLFSVGSSGIEMALGTHWQERLQPPPSWPEPGRAEPLLVVSGSCSPITAAQIAWAEANGFAEVPLLPQAAEGGGFSFGCDLQKVISLLQEGRSVVVHTSRGADDERIGQAAEIFRSQGIESSASARLLGGALGSIAREVAGRTPVKRMVVAGGDTSSFAARAMGIEAVEMIAPLSPGAPLCKAYAPDSPVDGLEVNFKGGQVGKEDYFGMVRAGFFRF